MGRLLGFITSILLGLALGLAFGWLVLPLRPPQAPLTDLRADYRLDYVLMAAAAYQAERDPALAVERLDRLGGRSAESTAIQAYQLATQAGYTPQELLRLEDLIRAVHSNVAALPAGEPTPTPRMAP